MGKRKKSSRGPTGPKKKEPLATTFKCVFCAHENSVSVKIDKKQGVGNLSCKSCTQTFQTATNYLTQAVDVYAEWIDACDAVAKETANADAATYSRPIQPHPSASRAAAATEDKATEEDDGFIDDDDVDPEENYADD